MASSTGLIRATKTKGIKDEGTINGLISLTVTATRNGSVSTALAAAIKLRN